MEWLKKNVKLPSKICISLPKFRRGKENDANKKRYHTHNASDISAAVSGKVFPVRPLGLDGGLTGYYDAATQSGFYENPPWNLNYPPQIKVDGYPSEAVQKQISIFITEYEEYCDRLSAADPDRAEKLLDKLHQIKQEDFINRGWLVSG